MKTNHQRGYKANVDAPRNYIRGYGLVSGDQCKGNRGLSRARVGLKKSWKKEEKRRRRQDIRNEIKKVEDVSLRFRS